MSKKSITKEWWETTFDKKYTITYVDATPYELTKKQVNFLQKNLKLKKGAKVLDLACGFGRHSIELAKRGYDVTGVDCSKHLIRLAREEAIKQNVKVTFIQEDIRRIAFKNEFDAVINMFTSFGYFKNEKDHPLVLGKISQALKAKGKFLIDLNNSIRTVSIILKDGFRDKKNKLLTTIHKEKLSNGLILTTVTQLNYKTMRWNMIRSWKEKGKTKSYKTSIRLFFLPELGNLMKNNDLQIKKTFGNFNGTPFSLNSRRMIILAKKI